VRLLAILLAALGLSTPAAETATHRATASRSCFSKKLWSTDDQNRPCVRVLRVEEDGSFRAAVSNASGNRRFTVSVGNRAD
jgi:hypothetical protein